MAYRGPAVRAGAFIRDATQCTDSGRRGCVTSAVSQTSAANTLLACVLTSDVEHCITFLETLLRNICCTRVSYCEVLYCIMENYVCDGVVQNLLKHFLAGTLLLRKN